MSHTPSISSTLPEKPSSKRTRESTHHWTVDAIDSQGNDKKLKVRPREVLSLPRGERIVVLFDFLDPIGEAQGLLAGLFGLLATDYSIFPISFDKWSDMPQSYFNDCFGNIIKEYIFIALLERNGLEVGRNCGTSSMTHLRPKMRS